MLLGSMQQHWCGCILYRCSKATPGPQAKQAGLVMLRESHTCQAPCLPKVRVSFHPQLSWRGAQSHQQHVIPCSHSPAPGARVPGASPSLQLAASAPTHALRGLLVSLPHPQVLRAHLPPPELGMPKTLYGGCEIHISAFICLSHHTAGLAEDMLPVLGLISNSQCLSAVSC